MIPPNFVISKALTLFDLIVVAKVLKEIFLQNLNAMAAKAYSQLINAVSVELVPLAIQLISNPLSSNTLIDESVSMAYVNISLQRHNLSFVILNLWFPTLRPNFVSPNFVIPSFVILNFVIPNFVIPNFVILLNLRFQLLIAISNFVISNWWQLQPILILKLTTLNFVIRTDVIFVVFVASLSIVGTPQRKTTRRTVGR